jgi:hypothetical protein
MIGNGPNLGVEADCGDHVIEATADGLASEKRTIRVDMGSATNLRFDLGEAGLGTLSLMVEPVTAELFIDGKSVAVGPVEVEDIAKGDHTVGAILDGYEPLEQRVSVKAGEVTRLDLVLTEASGDGSDTASTTASTAASTDGKKAKAQKPPKAREGRGKKALLGGASVLAAGVGTAFVYTAYNNYNVHYVPGISRCRSEDTSCQTQWNDYHREGIRRYQYIGYGLVGAGVIGLGTTGVMIITTENGTPIFGITGVW